MGVSLEKIEKWEKKKKSKKLLRVVYNDSSAEIRARAIRALAGIEDYDIINQLVTFIRDPEPDVRLASIETLGKIGSARAMEFIRAVLEKETDQRIVEAAKVALTAIREKMNKDEIA
ncbi:MAG TPA: HEAT repeat domain-containing protein [Ruminiclostridium sp.]|nr:HEAT repeat domain-containing protein [Clostridiaceae bacterium]HAA25994.1 HEAT repeat domain-containing protein [Ruminiclostridium sp.]